MRLRLPRPTTNSTLIFLGAAFFVYNVEYAIILPSVLLYLERLGASNPIWLGASIGAVPLASMLTAPIYSYYLDRFTISHAVVFSFVCELIGSLWYACATSPAQVVASRFVAGCGNLMVIAYTYIGIAIKDSQGRSVWSAKIGGISKLGMLLGPAFNLLLAKVDIHNVLVDVDSLNAPGWFMFWVFLALFIVLPFVYREPQRLSGAARAAANRRSKALHINAEDEKASLAPPPLVDETGVVPPPPVESVPRVFNAGLLSLLVAKFISQFYQMVFETILTPMTHAVYNFDPVENSYLYSGVGVVATVSLIIIMVASKKKVPDRRLIYIGHCIEGVGVLLFSVFWWHSDDMSRWPNVYVGLVLPASVLVFGLPFLWTPVSSLGMKVSHISRQGAAQSMLSAVNGAASILAPLAAGLFVNDEGTNLRPLCIMLSALWGLNTLVFLVTHKALAPSDDDNVVVEETTTTATTSATSEVVDQSGTETTTAAILTQSPTANEKTPLLSKR
jgi:hypothetical protein